MHLLCFVFLFFISFPVSPSISFIQLCSPEFSFTFTSLPSLSSISLSRSPSILFVMHCFFSVLILYFFSFNSLFFSFFPSPFPRVVFPFSFLLRLIPFLMAILHLAIHFSPQIFHVFINLLLFFFNFPRIFPSFSLSFFLLFFFLSLLPISLLHRFTWFTPLPCPFSAFT